MNKNKYVIFYKEKNCDNWKSKRLHLPFSEWENYCKKQHYEQYEIRDLSKYTPDVLHLTTYITKFNGKYYLKDEKIPFPVKNSKIIEKFDVSIIWDEEYANWDIDYDCVYNGEPLCTCVTVEFKINNHKYLIHNEAQCFVCDFPEFLEELKRNNYAVYTNEEYTQIKWIAWIKDNKVRIIQQKYNYKKITNNFDVMVDKDYFFRFGYHLIDDMQNYINADTEKYKKYIDKKLNNK